MYAGGDAVVIALDGDLRSPALVDRWSQCLVDRAADPTLSQPYHAAAEELGIEKGRERIAHCERAARASADAILATVISALPSRPAGAGLVLGAGHLASTLEGILQSHVQLHTAEGELLRTALREAAEAIGLDVLGVRERELTAHVTDVTGLQDDEIAVHLVALGRVAGRPWTKREKHATLAAWCALAS